MAEPERPRLLYFNGPWDYLGERMKAAYLRPFERLLAQDFDVVSVVGDCDFPAEVARHRPDLVLFHTGTESTREGGDPEVRITGTQEHPDLPRLGFIWRDPFSPSRAVAMNRLRAWGVHAVVTINRPTDSPIPYFRDSLYLPFWIDDAVFRDYGEPKVIPVTLAGSGWLHTFLYSWRRDIAVGLMHNVGMFHSPSLGNEAVRHDFTGENYARLLNRSYFSAGCGTINRYLTLKLLEIPAARCCLIAEETEVLKALGFRDGENCVFAIGSTVSARVQALLEDRGRLTAMTDAGYALVHARHTQRHRRLFIEWYRLWRIRGPGQRIVQNDPFGPLVLVDEGRPNPPWTFPTENPLVAGLLEGYRFLDAGDWTSALERFEWVTGNIAWVAEANLGAAICHLMRGMPDYAYQRLLHNFKHLLQHHHSPQPDPIDQAFLAVTLVRQGNLNQAVATAGDWAHVRHPALNALRWLFAQYHPSLT